MDDDLRPGLFIDPGCIAAEDHRQPILRDAHAAQCPQVMVIKARCDDPNGRPSRRWGWRRTLTDDERSEGIVSIER
jgi:hypothetical protein